MARENSSSFKGWPLMSSLSWALLPPPLAQLKLPVQPGEQQQQLPAAMFTDPPSCRGQIGMATGSLPFVQTVDRETGVANVFPAARTATEGARECLCSTQHCLPLLGLPSWLFCF